MTDRNPSPTARKKRLWAKLLAGALVVPIAVIAAIPLGLATPPGQRWLLRAANRGLAPGGGRIVWTTLRVSWFAPTTATGFVLRDAQGDAVIAAPRATLDCTLGQLLFDRPRFGTLLLDRAALDIERRPDGTVDVYETIKPVLNFDPATHVKIVIQQGRLRFRGDPLAGPLEAEQAGVTLEIGPAPRPITWQLDLKQSAPAGAAEQAGPPASLAISGQYERWWERIDERPRQGQGQRSPKDLVLKIEGHAWPLAAEGAGLAAQGVLEGGFGFARRSGLWSLSGNASVSAFELDSPFLAGDRLRLERITGSWDLEKTEHAWVARRFELSAPIATISAAGPLEVSPGANSRIEGTLDLAALSQQLPHLLRLRPGIALDKGTARVRAESRPDAWEVDARVSNLQARDGGRAFTLQSPAELSARVKIGQATLSLQRLTVRMPFLDASGEGDLDTGISWTAKVDLAGLERQLRDLVEFGKLQLGGTGDLAGNYRRQGTNFSGYVSATFQDLHIGGLVASTLKRDEVRIEAALDGPASDLGLPCDWGSLEFKVRTGTLTAHLRAKPRVAAREATVSVDAPFAYGDRKGRLEGRVSGHWNETAAVIELARVAIVPEDAESPGEPIAIVAEGHFDRARGELVLTPPPGVAASAPAIALSPDGLRIAGIGQPNALRVDGALSGDLAAVGRLIGSWGGPALGPLTGRWSAQTAVRETDGSWQFGGQINVPGGPLRVALQGGYQPARDRIDLAEIVLSSRYAALEASGQINDPDGAQRVDLLGRLTPDWKAINDLLQERIEPRAHVAGRGQPVRLQGSLTGAGPAGLEGELGVDLIAADIFGMSLGPTPIVVRVYDGQFHVKPIDTTLNQGRLHLMPQVVLDDPAGPALRLGPDSWISDARINDEVSHRVLAFAAPVLDQATRARGRVSVRLKEANFPVSTNPERLKSTTVTGAVLFQDTEFVAGPIANQLFDLIGLEDRPSVKLEQPVTLAIADRRVYQQGLTIPLGQLSAITMEGWVDFDRNLALKASVPILPTMLRGRPDLPVINDVLGDLRITVPISGTLAKPELDRHAFNLANQNLGKTLLERAAGRGAVDLLQRLFPPRDPNAPPPLTPAERRAQRQQRRQERQMQP
jgi:translocation and assembly module TamB